MGGQSVDVHKKEGAPIYISFNAPFIFKLCASVGNDSKAVKNLGADPTPSLPNNLYR
jgi:hypothetical protein